MRAFSHRGVAHALKGVQAAAGLRERGRVLHAWCTALVTLKRLHIRHAFLCLSILVHFVKFGIGLRSCVKLDGVVLGGIEKLTVVVVAVIVIF